MNQFTKNILFMSFKGEQKRFLSVFFISLILSYLSIKFNAKIYNYNKLFINSQLTFSNLSFFNTSFFTSCLLSNISARTPQWGQVYAYFSLHHRNRFSDNLKPNPHKACHPHNQLELHIHSHHCAFIIIKNTYRHIFAMYCVCTTAALIPIHWLSWEL